MDSLPLHLVEKILFKLDPKSLAMMQCTNISIKSYISDDPNFKLEYYSQLGSGLVHISSAGSKYLFCHSLSHYRSIRDNLYDTFQILGSCSGLLLLYVDGLCVANPFTKRFRFLQHSGTKLFSDYGGTIRSIVKFGQTKNIGFAVDQIDRTTQRFRIVCLIKVKSKLDDRTNYQFHINDGDSWRFSIYTITCSSSKIAWDMKPVYCDGALHWLRKDGSIIAFDLTTEQPRLIPIESPKNLSSTILFTAVKNELTLISVTKEVIYVYSLENIVTDPKWVLVRQLENIVVPGERMVEYLEVAAYDGEILVLPRASFMEKEGIVRMIHRYDLRANRCRVMGWIPGFCDATRDYYQFKPSFCSVIGLDDDRGEMARENGDNRLHSLSMIMRLVAEITPHASNLIKKKTKLG